DKSPTFLHSGHGTFSSIDLSISDPSLFLDFEWSVENDLHGSDHFPLILKNTELENTAHPPKWKMSKANWTQFESLCLEKLTKTSVNSTTIDDYTSILLTIADDSIPKTSGKSMLGEIYGLIMIVKRPLPNAREIYVISNKNLPRLT
ncbi:hypothetical protein BOW49_13365, partial [Solemya velum gill symbiont]|uniref:hypothetical protein n=1 Tax=Solemya velum gill symbiont TaxID=2340 RepID=UPI0009C76722